MNSQANRQSAGTATLTLAQPILPDASSAIRILPANWEKPGFSQIFAAQVKAVGRPISLAWDWIRQRLNSHQSRKRLRVCESVSLGEKRVIVLIEVDGEQFLVAGASNSISVLAHLEKPAAFSDVLRQRFSGDSDQV